MKITRPHSKSRAIALIACALSCLLPLSAADLASEVEQLNLDFHFATLLDNLLTSSDAFIHAGSNVMKTLWRSTPNG